MNTSVKTTAKLIHFILLLTVIVNVNDGSPAVGGKTQCPVEGSTKEVYMVSLSFCYTNWAVCLLVHFSIFFN